MPIIVFLFNDVKINNETERFDCEGSRKVDFKIINMIKTQEMQAKI